MPLTKSAIKALKQDRARTVINRHLRRRMKTTIDQYTSEPKAETLSTVYQTLDRAAKKNIIHPNKAARLKSRLSQQLTNGPKIAAPTPKTKKAKAKSLLAKKVRKTKKAAK
jgi:small subunit ribosomal protein S20